jgi:hypothetical protein
LHPCNAQAANLGQQPRPPFHSFKPVIHVNDDPKQGKVDDAEAKGKDGQAAVVRPANGGQCTDGRSKGNVQADHYLWNEVLPVVLSLAHMMHEMVDFLRIHSFSFFFSFFRLSIYRTSFQEKKYRCK